MEIRSATMKHLIGKTILIASMIAIPGTAALAATTDGILDNVSEYSFNTEATPNDKHNTDSHGTANSEYNDGSGGDRYDLNYLGVDISDGNFQFGVVGGSILGSIYDGVGELGTNPLYIGDIAINVLQDGETYVDPTQNTVASVGWDYAIRILSVDGDVQMQLLGTNVHSSWQAVDIFGFENDSSTAAHHDGHHSDTFRLNGGDVLASISGSYSNNGADLNVLEGSFDLGLLSLFDEATGGSIITYLTMSCANDEAIVHADIAAVPVPTSIWLFGSALIGFVSLGRSTRV